MEPIEGSRAEQHRRTTATSVWVALYSTAVSEIAGFKQQQWNVTNYGLLLYGAVGGLKIAKPAMIEGEIRSILLGGICVVAVVGCLLLFSLEIALFRARQRLLLARKNMFHDEAPIGPYGDYFVVGVLVGVLIVGLLLSAWVLYSWH